MNAWLERQPSWRYALIVFVLLGAVWVLAMYFAYWASGVWRDQGVNAVGFSGHTINLGLTAVWAAVMSLLMTWLRYRRARRHREM